MRIILSGGGTGGHIYPALAIAQGLKERLPSVDLLYIGTRQGMESKLVPEAGLEFKHIDITSINRNSMLKASKSIIRFPVSFFQSWDIIKKFAPDVVIGTGGYVSFPVVMAASFYKCKTLIHEQNAYPGLANRNLAKRVDCVLITFEEARQFLKSKRIVLTGLPVRKEISEVDLQKAAMRLGFSRNKFTLVAFGGSQGAKSINQAMIEVIEKYRQEDMQVIWITGENNYSEINEKLKMTKPKSQKLKLLVFSYMHNMQDALAVADLAVCRAGASTLSELALLGLPAIFVPYPYAAENHQEKNARSLVRKKAAEMIIDEFLDGDTLGQKINKIKDNRNTLEQMRANMKQQAKPKALENIIDEVFNL